ncbi:LysR family transcriptional regulator [Rhodococcus sp. 1R11]|uniref:LysR family transcriptional regulator n=1 Tax=Rhodococcus sp. 1R11 TaxID=2559614 RepID=UPI0014306BCC|nr:LysR family transcriptional regulator [Rhodococcus sp. 1R11]
MLNPVHLRTFMMVIRTGSFADAARRLGYTGSAVSQQIGALEKDVRLQLFDRDPHSVRPTAAADFLASRSQEALSALTELEEDVRAIADGAIGRVRLGSFPTASEHVMPLAMADFVRENPGVELLLDEGEPDQLIPRLRDRELDLAVVYRYDQIPQSVPKGFRTTTLLREQLVLLLPANHFMAGHPVALTDLQDETWIATREGTPGAATLLRLCGSAGYVPQIDCRSNDYAVIRGFVRSGLGVALVPALGYKADDGIHHTLIENLDSHRTVMAMYRASRANPAIAGAVRALQAVTGEVAARSPKFIEAADRS